jgi:predicted ATPase
LIGETMLTGNGNAAGAEQEFHAALALAQKQGAPLWELRAATSLARLSRDGNGAGAAREGLAKVYRSFSEGLTEPDLEQAKTVLG